MNATLAAAIGAILRHFLTLLAGYLVSKGIWTDAEAGTYVSAAVVATLALLWSLYQKHRSKLFADKAREMPSGVSEEQVKREVARDRAEL